MTTRLYFVRHGATPRTAENRFSGAAGVDLSDEGRRQAGLLAQRLANDDLCAAYTSPLSRALETATILCAPNGFQIYLEAGSNEPLPGWFHFGFLVESAAACTALYERMRRDQITITRPLVSVPFANYFCADPDGHEVQVYFDPA